MPLTTRYMAALQLARNAGQLAHEFFVHRHFMFGGQVKPEDFAVRSVVTLRTLIRTKLAAAFPGDAIVDEDYAGSTLASLDRAWVIDAISGRRNFMRGIPFYSIALSYVEDDRCELGVVFDPEHDDLFHVRRGDGSFCEHAGTDTRLGVASCDSLDGALLCVADDEGHADPGYLIVRHGLMDVGASIRAMGTGALELAHVAAGRCDGFIGLHVDTHRLRGGMLMVEEAGGYTLQPGTAGQVRADGPLLACAGGIAAALSDAAKPWSTRQAPLERAAPPNAVH
jgi:myo-inositol-1(or 4)-monophosphatase